MCQNMWWGVELIPAINSDWPYLINKKNSMIILLVFFFSITRIIFSITMAIFSYNSPNEGCYLFSSKGWFWSVLEMRSVASLWIIGQRSFNMLQMVHVPWMYLARDNVWSSMCCDLSNPHLLLACFPIWWYVCMECED